MTQTEKDVTIGGNPDVKKIPQGVRGRLHRKKRQIVYVVVREQTLLAPHNIDYVTTIEGVFDSKAKAETFIAKKDASEWFIVPRKLR